MQQDRPTPDDIDELIATITNLRPEWDVDDWTHEGGMHDDDTLTVTVSWDADAALEHADQPTVLDRVAALEAEYDRGAPIDNLINEFIDRDGWSVERIDRRIEQLRRQGELYEPSEGFLRKT
jgi:replicative DNA helicase Mcm